MSGLFAGTPLERPVTCDVCEQPLADCACPRGADGVVRRPKDQTATVRCEKRRKGKVVTTVSGLDPVASALPDLLRDLKKLCGGGGTVADGTVEIQGDHRDRVSTELRRRGYPVREV